MKNKKFDCVKMMRDIRNEVTEEWRNLSINEIKNRLDKELPNFKTKKKKSKVSAHN